MVMGNCRSSNRDNRRFVDESSLSSFNDVMFHRCWYDGLFGKSVIMNEMIE